jgi:hypothetical protein
VCSAVSCLSDGVELSQSGEATGTSPERQRSSNLRRHPRRAAVPAGQVAAGDFGLPRAVSTLSTQRIGVSPGCHPI